MNRTLEEYIGMALTNNHYRYMPDNVVNEIHAMTPACTGGLDERMYWIKNGLSEYPKCARCEHSLTSRNWFASNTKARQAKGEPAKGYRKFCSKTCAMNDTQKHQKTRQTSIDRYGVEHPLQAPEIQARRKLTNLQRYGAEHPMAWSSKRFQDAIERAYGVSKVRHIEGVSDKIRDNKRIETHKLLKTRITELQEKFEVQLVSELPPNPNFDRLYDIELSWQHGCGHVYSSNISIRGLRFCPRCSNGTSRAERDIGDWIEGLGLTVQRRSKHFGFEVDLYVPELNVGIEYDGTYWHSAKFISKQQSMMKLEGANDIGFQLITIQEHLWLLSQDLVKARLMSIFGLNKKIHGRKCLVQAIDMRTANEFFGKTHLQGGARALHAYGLVHDGELLSAMSFGKPRFARASADWELVRYSVKPGITVHGGANKILNSFRAHHAGSILSYADRCWSTGALYKKLGFEFLRNSEPSYFWVSGNNIFTRYQTQKSKLEKLLGDLQLDFEPALSEEDNMRNAKFLKVYDRGNSVWLLK